MDCEQLIFTIIIGFIFIIYSKCPSFLCYNLAFFTPYAMGVKNAELNIKVKGGHFEHIIKIKFNLMYYHKYSLTEINKKLSICTIEVIFGYVRSDPKINFSFGSPCISL